MTAKAKAVALLQYVRNLRIIEIISEEEFQSMIEVLKRLCLNDKYLEITQSRIIELARNKPQKESQMILDAAKILHQK